MTYENYENKNEIARPCVHGVLHRKSLRIVVVSTSLAGGGTYIEGVILKTGVS